LEAGGTESRALVSSIGKIEVALRTSAEAANLERSIAASAAKKLASIPDQSVNTGGNTQVPSQVAIVDSNQAESQQVKATASAAEQYLQQNYNVTTLVNAPNISTNAARLVCRQTVEDIIVAGAFGGSGVYSWGAAAEFFGAVLGVETGGIGFIIAGLAIFIFSSGAAISTQENC
jgi:hypothetical protein